MTDPTQAEPSAPQPQAAPSASPVEQRAAFLTSHQTDTAAASPPVATDPPKANEVLGTLLPDTAIKPNYLPDSFWDKDKGVVKGEDFKKHLDGLEKVKADLEAARGDTPAKAEDYKAELPKEFKLPEGLPELPADMEFNQSDPRLIALRKIANETGMSQKQFSAVLATEAITISNMVAKLKERDASLGENAANRLGELQTWLNASFDKDTANDIGAALLSARQVKALESMKQALTSQGVGSFNAGGRESPDANDGRPANWDAMKPVDRIVWNRQQQREGARTARH